MEEQNCTDKPPVKSMESDRVQVRLSDEWRSAVEKQAKKERLSLSDWIRRAILHRLPATARRDLPEIKPGRPKSD